MSNQLVSECCATGKGYKSPYFICLGGGGCNNHSNMGKVMHSLRNTFLSSGSVEIDHMSTSITHTEYTYYSDLYYRTVPLMAFSTATFYVSDFNA